MFKWVDEAVIYGIRNVDAKHEEFMNDVKELRKSMMEHFEFLKTRHEKMEEEAMGIKMEEEAMRIKMNEEMIESYNMIWFY